MVLATAIAGWRLRRRIAAALGLAFAAMIVLILYAVLHLGPGIYAARSNRQIAASLPARPAGEAVLCMWDDQQFSLPFYAPQFGGRELRLGLRNDVGQLADLMVSTRPVYCLIRKKQLAHFLAAAPVRYQIVATVNDSLLITNCPAAR